MRTNRTDALRSPAKRSGTFPGTEHPRPAATFTHEMSLAWSANQKKTLGAKSIYSHYPYGLLQGCCHSARRVFLPEVAESTTDANGLYDSIQVVTQFKPHRTTRKKPSATHSIPSLSVINSNIWWNLQELIVNPTKVNGCFRPLTLDLESAKNRHHFKPFQR